MNFVVKRLWNQSHWCFDQFKTVLLKTIRSPCHTQCAAGKMESPYYGWNRSTKPDSDANILSGVAYLVECNHIRSAFVAIQMFFPLLLEASRFDERFITTLSIFWQKIAASQHSAASLQLLHSVYIDTMILVPNHI